MEIVNFFFKNHQWFNLNFNLWIQILWFYITNIDQWSFDDSQIKIEPEFVLD